MEVLAYGLFGVGVYYLVAYFMGRARADKVIAELRIQPSAEAIKEEQDIAVATKEVEDAKIEYQKSRDKYNADLTKQSSTSAQPSAGPGKT